LNAEEDGGAWHITPNASDDGAYAILAHDRVWNSFAIADLLPPFRASAQVAIARHAGGIRSAACLVLRHPELTVVSPDGDDEGAGALLDRLDLPNVALIQAQSRHVPAIERYYRPQASWQQVERMAATPALFRMPFRAPAPVPHAERLTIADLPALAALYNLYPTGHFRPDLLEHGVFYGIREGERLVAAGGTHVVAAPYGLAVLGNIFTHPATRRRGYAGAVTAALTVELFRLGVSDIVLNVLADNTPAIRLYERLGFALAHPYLTGLAERIER